VPKFVKEFGKVGEAIRNAIQAYATEVRARTFPGPEHTYAVKDVPAKEPAKPAAKSRVKARTPA
jgi:3-methyl-2-oxobutanoate hydroxymethyltransferase